MCFSLSLSLSLYFISFFDFMPRIAAFGFLLLNYLMFVTLMPCLYVLSCGPKIRVSCILLDALSAGSTTRHIMTRTR